MKDLKKVLAEISSDKKLAEEFKNLKSTEEFIKFCENLGVQVTEEELNKVVISKLSKAKEMSEDELELIAGGRMDFRKIQSLVLAATTFMGVGTNIMPSTFAMSSSVNMSKVTSMSQEELDKQFEMAVEDNDFSKCEKLLSQGATITEHALDIIYNMWSPKEDVIKMIIEKYDHVPNENQVEVLLKLDVNVDTMKSLIKKGFQPNEHTLNCACQRRKGEIAKFLVEQGVKPTNETLESACRIGDIDLVKFLVEQGVKPTNETLESACRTGDIDLVKFLVGQGIKPTTESLEALFNFGTIDLNPDLMRFLIENGAEPTEEILEIACVWSGIEIYDVLGVSKVLIEYGIKPTEEALKYACRSNNVELVELFIENGAVLPDDILTESCHSHGLNMAKFLVDKGIKPTDETLENFISSSYYDLDMDLLNFLLENGAKITDKALENACLNPWIDVEIIKLFIEKGAKATDKALINFCGNINCNGINLEAINLLVSKGANLNNNTKALEAAYLAGNLEMADFLVSHGAKPTEEMLEHCCFNGNKKVFEFLIKNKVKTTFKSILHASLSYDNIDEFINALIDNDFDLTSKNEANQNILMYLIDNINIYEYIPVNTKVFNILLDRNAYSKEEITEALKFAQEKSREDIAKIFSEKLESMK